MKLDVINEFEKYLSYIKNKPSTRQRKVYMLKHLLKNQDFSNIKDIDQDKLLNAVNNLKSDSQRRIAKATIDNFTSLGFKPTYDVYIALRKRMKISGKRPAIQIDAPSIEANINSIKDDNLRLAYKLQLATGMRVSEVAKLTVEDVQIDDAGSLTLRLRNTKAGKTQYISFSEEYCVSRLKELLSKKCAGEKLFFSASTLKKRAWERGFETHDLRRIYARKKYELEKQNNSAVESMETVKDALRHSNSSITKGYVNGGVTKRKRRNK